METKNTIDIAAKKLWENINEFSSLIVDIVGNMDVTDTSFEFYYEVFKKSNEFARYLDKNFGND